MILLFFLSHEKPCDNLFVMCLKGKLIKGNQNKECGLLQALFVSYFENVSIFCVQGESWDESLLLVHQLGIVNTMRSSSYHIPPPHSEMNRPWFAPRWVGLAFAITLHRPHPHSRFARLLPHLHPVPLCRKIWLSLSFCAGVRV